MDAPGSTLGPGTRLGGVGASTLTGCGGTPSRKKNSKKRRPKRALETLPASYVVKTHRENEYSSEEEEDEDDYRQGGYHPVELGQLIAQRYLVRAKLGWGHFSTVWLAHDVRAGAQDDEVALKIVKSAAHYTEAARDEIRILERVKASDPQRTSCVIRLLEHFEVNGPHGRHVALAFEKLGCNLLTLIRMYRYKGLPIPLVRLFARQAAQGVAYLHRCRIVHTDLKPENVLLERTPTLVRLLPRTARRASDAPSPVRGDDSARRECDEHDESIHDEAYHGSWGSPDDTPTASRRAQLADDEGDNDESTDERARLHLPWTASELRETFGQAYRVKLVDLGNACWFDKHFTDDVQTRQYRAPEVILGARYDEKIDVWSLACIIFELLTGDLLFEPKSGRSYDKNDDHLAQMQELLGRLPRHVALAGKHARNYFTRRGELRYIKSLKFWSLRDVLRDKYRFSEANATAIADFLLPMLNVDVQRRVSAEDVLQLPWIRHVDVNDFESAFLEPALH